MLRIFSRSAIGGGFMAAMILFATPQSASAFWGFTDNFVINWRFSNLNDDRALQLISDTVSLMRNNGAQDEDVDDFFNGIEFYIDDINNDGVRGGNTWLANYYGGATVKPCAGAGRGLLCLGTAMQFYISQNADFFAGQYKKINETLVEAIMFYVKVRYGHFVLRKTEADADGLSSADWEDLMGTIGDLAKANEKEIARILAETGALLKRRARRKKLFFVTYTKKRDWNPRQEIYSGRTHGFGDPWNLGQVEKALKLRNSGHHMLAEDYKALPEKACASREYPAIRGHEQIMINVHGGSKNKASWPGTRLSDKDEPWPGTAGTSGNARNEIAHSHRLRDYYINRGKSLTVADCFDSFDYVYTNYTYIK